MSDIEPTLGKNVYIAPTAYVGGDVTLGDQTTVMHHAVIRGDIAPITLGARVNVQDGAILHTKYGVPLVIGDDVGIGHRAVVHCKSVATRTLIGTGAIVLDGCIVGSCCIIAAGAVVPPETTIPDRSVVMGVPAKVVRQVNDDDLASIDHVVRSYVTLGELHASGHYHNIAAS